MSITLGIYDLFSYLTPGILYLYAINEVLKLFSLSLNDLLPAVSNGSTAQDIMFAVLGLVAAFVTGHIFDMLARWFVFRLIYRDKTSQTVLDVLKVRDAGANIQFEAKDWHLLLVLLRQRNLEVAQSFDKHEADSIMFRNISLIALLMAFIVAARAVLGNPFQWILFVVGLVVCIMAASRSRTLHTWFFEGIYLAALEYGTSVDEVLAYKKEQVSKVPQKTRRIKSRK